MRLLPTERKLALLLLAFLPCGSVEAAITIGSESKVPADPRQEYARYVRYRPADGQMVRLNPPRFSWPYTPEIVAAGRLSAGRRFTLQLSKSKDFGRQEVEIRDTVYNFYNFLPELKGARTWYWRVGYDVGTPREKWSEARSFTLADDAVVWDRSGIAARLKAIQGHPRMLFHGATRDAILKLRDTDPRSRELAKYIIASADRTLKEKWYKDFPADDKKPLSYMSMTHSMVNVAFAYLLTGNEKYHGFKDRMLRIASWPAGGYASPEKAGASDKWETHLTEYLGLFYDWFYDELTPDQRKTVRYSLQWRIDHTINNFAWRQQKGKMMAGGSIAVACSSHPYENLMVTLPGALAICDESPVAAQALELGVHYLIGITSSHGEDEGWNEGPGYGNGKMKWLTDATSYLQTAIPELNLPKNEMYRAYTDFFARLTPLGARHSSFGNRGYEERDWTSSRITNFRRVAMLCDDGAAMQNWLDTRRLIQERGGSDMPFSPWIDYVLPYYAQEPKPVVDSDCSKLFALEGWVMASSAPASDLDRQREAVSMTFACRPRGGYSHSFRCENGFDIHAYDQTIAVGGDTTSNQSFFANHTMSHNTVLVNGQEQIAAREGSAATYGRIIAYREGDGFVYWAGDATAAYGPKTGLARFIRHVLFVDNAYFVIFDDLALADSRPAGTFQWLYHITPEVPLDFDPARFRLDYAVGDTRVLVQHLAHLEDLTFQDLRGNAGMINPITGENASGMDKWLKPGKEKKKLPKPLAAHHLWISHKTPSHTMQFLAVIVPYRSTDAEPKVAGLGPRGVQVEFRSQKRTIAFDPADARGADFVVDTAGIAR